MTYLSGHARLRIMKKELEKAIKYAEDMLGEYEQIGQPGIFGVITIKRELEEARKVLDTFNKRSELEIKEIIKSLEEIE